MSALALASSPSMAAAVRFDQITKRFPGVVALEDVSFDVAPGPVISVAGRGHFGVSPQADGLHRSVGLVAEVLLAYSRPVCENAPEDQGAVQGLAGYRAFRYAVLHECFEL